jgi:hypothetical protein
MIRDSEDKVTAYLNANAAIGENQGTMTPWGEIKQRALPGTKSSTG